MPYKSSNIKITSGVLEAVLHNSLRIIGIYALKEIQQSGQIIN
jgi:hypothetical protein